MTAVAATLEPLRLRQMMGDVVDRLRVIVPAGVIVGGLVGGVGSRLGMLLLRITSDSSVHGVLSDDEFTIGRITLFGSINLLIVGTAFGILGAALYGLLRPWLIGPPWFQNLTTALGCGAVIGSMLVHTDGVDFTLLTPTWLAIGLFVAIPALFGALIGPTLAWAARPGSWPSSGRGRWLPIVAVIWHPLIWMVVVVIAVVLLASAPLRLLHLGHRARAHTRTRVVVQGGWLAAALLGLVTLVGDASSLL